MAVHLAHAVSKCVYMRQGHFWSITYLLALMQRLCFKMTRRGGIAWKQFWCVLYSDCIHVPACILHQSNRGPLCFGIDDSVRSTKYGLDCPVVPPRIL